MRIVSEWNHKSLKVTVFHMNGKYSIKVEDNLLEQTYKFRDGQVTNLNHLKTILNKAFFDKCIKLFDEMHQNRSLLFETDEDDFEFEEII